MRKHPLWKFRGIFAAGTLLAFFCLFLTPWFPQVKDVLGWLPCLEAENAVARLLAAAYGEAAGAAALAALAVLAPLLLLTLFFGRFYCSLLCPLGIWQDVCGTVHSRPTPNRPGGRWPRLAVFGVVFGMAFAGCAWGLMAGAPYAVFGAGVAVPALLPLPFWTLAGCALPLLLITALALWRKRFFCAAVCPIGTLLSFFARGSQKFWAVRISPACVQCGRCAKVCPVDAINPAARAVDNASCVRCLACLNVCGRQAVRFGPPSETPAAAPDTATAPTPGVLNRREFLGTGAVTLLSLAAGAARTQKSGDLILPPGAGSLAEFSARCTRCHLCAASCPPQILRPGAGRYGIPHLDLTRGFCPPECGRCSRVCPTGALVPLAAAAKRRWKIAAVEYTPADCLAFQDEKCGRCAQACAVGAMTMVTSPTGFVLPKLDKKKCLGCGACVHACPATPKALAVIPIAKQVAIDIM